MTEDLNDLMCPHSAAGRPERFPAKACILAGECGCVYGAEWSRALRLADAIAQGAGGRAINKQRGYVSIPEGFFVALFAAGVVVGVVIGVALAFGLPWAWDLFTR